MTVDNDMIWTPNIDIINRIHGFSNEDQLHHKCHITYQVSTRQKIAENQNFRDLYPTLELIGSELTSMPS